MIEIDWNIVKQLGQEMRFLQALRESETRSPHCVYMVRTNK